MELATLAPQFKNYEDKWIAINEADNTIVASGDDVFEVDAEVQRKGLEDVLFFKVPRFDVSFVPRTHAI